MDQMNLIEMGAKLGMYFVPFLFALCFHEFAHGMVAKWRGDNTAEVSGRLSLNPLVHADPLGTFILPISAILLGSPLFFGWAKPVPVNSRNLARPRWDMFWISLAGPLSNVLLALVSTVALGFVIAFAPETSTYIAIGKLLNAFIVVNMFLAMFNLIPVHPLDGGKVIEPFLPYNWNRWLDDNQAQLNMALLVILLLAGNVLAAPVLWICGNLLHVSSLIGHSFA